jgi:hypothetical protein
MQIDLKQQIKDHIGRPIKEAVDAAPLDIATVCIGALTATIDADRKSTLSEKTALFKMASRIANSDGAIEVSPEELAILRKRVNDAFPSPILVGAAMQILGG